MIPNDNVIKINPKLSKANLFLDNSIEYSVDHQINFQKCHGVNENFWLSFISADWLQVTRQKQDKWTYFAMENKLRLAL